MKTDMNIGPNIKRLRKEKNMTQEQLADLLNISCAAVSKWENADSYPDITLLFPLATLFSVSVDELMGYDAARTEKHISELLKNYRNLQVNGQYSEAETLICNARAMYPGDFRVMNTYMWHIAGGSAANDQTVLRSHSDELMKLCACILNSCTDETLRLEALTMKAKLLHANGNTDGALAVLDGFPSFAQSSGQKKEQLFAKDTDEFRYWNSRNFFGLIDGASAKLARMVWYDPTLTKADKLAKTEQIADTLTETSKKDGMEFLCIMAHMVYAVLANNLSFSDSEIEDIIRIRQKQFACSKTIVQMSKQDPVLSEALSRMPYNGKDLLEGEINQLTQTNHPIFAKLREDERYAAILKI